ncbi:hypothetical protein GCM10010399_57000 [Dactylosporangium fulvum]|uniref:Secreted protein n=1 Tax=Dactylosporangium fulvum TaxID=53359 RepID=A0ABY5VUA6_9ACTN|nr:hypothetical protein [Dactylosporangium fulvum]UWP80835.1 hypothetical protein Dfulv_37730 [Dactylosporangium fulvum]
MRALVWVLVALFAAVAVQTALRGRHGEVRAARQAMVVDGLLESGTVSRARLVAAVDLLLRCERVDGAVEDLWTTAQARQVQQDAVVRLDVSAMQSGAEVRRLLAVSLERSLETDYAFLDWALTVQREGCRSTGRAAMAYSKALYATERSTAAKRDFIRCWDRVATTYGLRLRTENDL